jgi:hypothetical protein
MEKYGTYTSVLERFKLGKNRTNFMYIEPTYIYVLHVDVKLGLLHLRKNVNYTLVT